MEGFGKMEGFAEEMYKKNMGLIKLYRNKPKYQIKTHCILFALDNNFTWHNNINLYIESSLIQFFS